MSARARARRPADDELRRRALGDGARLVIDDPELGAIAVRLLEVVAEDLLELELAAALPVDPLCPGHEPLVQRRADALQQAAVRGVADDLVAEPVEDLLLRQPPDELLADEDVEVAAEASVGASRRRAR